MWNWNRFLSSWEIFQDWEFEKSTWETRFAGYQTSKWGGVNPILMEQENQKWELISENNSGSQRMPLWQLGKWVQKSLKVGTRSSLLALFAILLLLTLPPPWTQSCETKYAVVKRLDRKIKTIDPFPLSDKFEAILVAFGHVLWFCEQSLTQERKWEKVKCFPTAFAIANESCKCASDGWKGGWQFGLVRRWS